MPTNIKYASLSIDLAGLSLDKSLRLLPLGGFVANDGRPLPCAQWHMSEGSALRIINHWNNRPEQMPFDYEHQTQKSDFNGMPAPAAGWAVTGSFELRADGLYATPDFTERAKQYIVDKEYRYLSPVFGYDAKTGEVQMLYMAALTNTPGLTGLTELNPAMLKHYLNHSTKDTDVNKELLTLLGLAATATPEDATAAVTALKAEAAQVATLTAELATHKTEVATLKAAGASSDAGAQTIATLQASVAALTAQVEGSEVEKLVTAGLADGRILPATEKWARGLPVAQLTSFLAAQPVIAALSQQQTAGKTHGAGGVDENGLTADELAVCSSMGMTAKDFAAAKLLNV